MTENYWLIYAAATVMALCGVLFSVTELIFWIPCPVDRDDNVPLIILFKLSGFPFKMDHE